MTRPQIEALLIDQALGELSDEASALLEHHLDQTPTDRAYAAEVRLAVGCSASAVAMHPLVKAPRPVMAISPMWLRRAALVAFLAVSCGTAFVAGRSTRAGLPESPPIAEQEDHEGSSPWARYRIGENGQLSVILPSGSKS